MSDIRLYIPDSLESTTSVIEINSQQNHYLLNVMRCRHGDMIRVFNAKDGEWRATISTDRASDRGESLVAGQYDKAKTKLEQINHRKKQCYLVLEKRTKFLSNISHDKVHLIFAPFKAYPPSFVIQKATDLGAHYITPMKTQRTIIRTINADKLNIAAIEATEQSERLDVPIICPQPKDYSKILQELKNTTEAKIVLFFDTNKEFSIPVKMILQWITKAQNDIRVPVSKSISYYILIGPEGGFTAEEREEMLQFSSSASATIKSCIINLGDFVLRAETACIMAMSIIQLIV